MKKLRLYILTTFASGIVLSCGDKMESQNEPKANKSVDNLTTTVNHPLDALTQAELTQAIEILRAEGRYDSLTRIPELTLKEPGKKMIYAWKQGETFDRIANAVIRKDQKTFEAEIDISAKKINSWEPIENVQPALLFEEWIAAGEIWKESEEIVNELNRRGYTNLDDIIGAPLTTGYFGANESRDKRLLKVWLLDKSDIKTNLFAKPIAGITPIVDLNTNKVVDVILKKDVGRNDVTYDYDETSTKAKKMKPVKQVSPEGNNFSIKDDGMINWGKWNFHFKFDKRFGGVVSLGEFDGQSVVYQLSPNEMFVPYMDADAGWSYRSYMDIGEYGFGLLSSSLELGTDVPSNAVLMNAIVPTDDGTPAVYENVIGIFERNTGRPLWRHAEMLNETHESRQEIELVVRTIPVVGNYDYVMDYVFSSKGLLKVEVGATGMDAVKAVKARSMSDPTALMETKAGNLVAPNLIGVSHDHYLSFRIDVDIDGVNNTFVTDEVVPVEYKDNVRISGWESIEHPELTEGPISADDVEHDAYWRVVNKNSKNTLGQYKGYQILGHTALSVLNKDDYPQKRAAWSEHPLWVTPYDNTELYPSGKYPNQSDGTKGLAQWIKQERSIDNTDIVCWYTMGFHHLTRPEDWPVLPTVWHTLTLRPYHSFDKNPAIDVAK